LINSKRKGWVQVNKSRLHKWSWRLLGWVSSQSQESCLVF
jgi:hypothetical protein